MEISRSVVQEIMMESLQKRGISLYIKRDDLIDPDISGNKWRKLKYNLELTRSKKKEGILTFGGAYSNHLVATAAACRLKGLKSIGFVRGEELNPASNETLKRCAELGMELVFLPREEYAMRNDKAYHETLGADYPSMQIVPEGGANYYGMIGCQEIMSEVAREIPEIDFNHIFVAQGTTATSCGILLSLEEHQLVHVVPVLKGFDSISEMNELFKYSGLPKDFLDDLFDQVVVHGEYHFGGYGTITDELIDFIESFYQQTKVKLDPIYTGKAMFALMDQLEDPSFDDSNVLFVHTGGLQGITGVEAKLGRKLFE